MRSISTSFGQPLIKFLERMTLQRLSEVKHILTVSKPQSQLLETGGLKWSHKVSEERKSIFCVGPVSLRALHIVTSSVLTTSCFTERMKKMWKRQEFQEEKENTVCEEIKRVKKNEITKQKKECDNYWVKCTTVKQIHSTDSLALNQWMDWMNCLRQQFWKSPTLNLAHTELAERYIQGQERCTGHSAAALI